MILLKVSANRDDVPAVTTTNLEDIFTCEDYGLFLFSFTCDRVGYVHGGRHAILIHHEKARHMCLIYGQRPLVVLRGPRKASRARRGGGNVGVNHAPPELALPYTGRN